MAEMTKESQSGFWRLVAVIVMLIGQAVLVSALFTRLDERVARLPKIEERMERIDQRTLALQRQVDRLSSEVRAYHRAKEDD